MKKTWILLFWALFISPLAFAQKGWNWPKDSVQAKTAKENAVLYSDYVKSKNYSAAKEPFEWLMSTVPNLHKSLYKNGTKIYAGLVKQEKDPVLKRALQDSTMAIFERRISLYGKEAKVRRMQIMKAYSYYKNDKSQYQYLYELATKTFDLNQGKISSGALVAYLDIARKYKKESDKLTDDDIIHIYDKTSTILTKLKNTEEDPKKLKRFEKQSETLDKVFIATVKVDCDFITGKLAPKLEQNPNDLKLAKNIVKLSLVAKCSNSPAFLEAAKVVFRSSPDFGMAKVIGLKLRSAKQLDSALYYYDKALELTDIPTKKATILLEKAVISAKKGHKSNARKFALEAVRADASKKTAYTLIGNLYMGSYKACKQGKNMVKDRAVFIAAYEKFAKAGDSKGMKAAKEQFPTGEDIFTYNMNVGDKVQVGCWINETVTIRKR